MRRFCYFSVLSFGFPVSSFHCRCVVSLWRALPFIRKFSRRVTQSTPSTAHTNPPASSISEQDSFFSNATLRHASRQILLLLRDILIGFPALLLTVVSLVRLPSFIANIASACLSRQVSFPCRPPSTIIHCHAHPLMLVDIFVQTDSSPPHVHSLRGSHYGFHQVNAARDIAPQVQLGSEFS